MMQPGAARRIESLASAIQNLPEQVRWVHAQQDLIHARGCGIPAERGRRSVWVDRVIATAEVIGLGGVTVATMNLLLAIGLFLRQCPVGPAGLKGRLFVGIGAMREGALIQQFGESYGGPVICVDERNLRSFSKCQRVGLRALLIEWWRLWREMRGALSLSLEQGLSRPECLSWLFRGGHRFVYFRAWFRQYLRVASGLNVIGFSATSYAAYAAVSAGARAIYFVHGFQRRSLVYPEFDEVFCFNKSDAEHIQTRLPRASVNLNIEGAEVVNTRRIAMIAGDYGKMDEMECCRSFMEWAAERGLPVVIRRHPQDDSGYWEQWAKMDGVEISTCQCEFSEFIQVLRPRVLITRFSTTLFDGLLRGVLPVTLTDSEVTAADVVFPFRSVALRWPEEATLLGAVIEDLELFNRLVAQRRAIAFGQCGEAIDISGWQLQHAGDSGQQV